MLMYISGNGRVVTIEGVHVGSTVSLCLVLTTVHRNDRSIVDWFLGKRRLVHPVTVGDQEQPDINSLRSYRQIANWKHATQRSLFTSINSEEEKRKQNIKEETSNCICSLIERFFLTDACKLEEIKFLTYLWDRLDRQTNK